MPLRILVFLVISLAAAYIGNSQTYTIDRLKVAITTAKNDEIKLEAILKLCDQGYSLHPDTLLHYAKLANDLARQQKNRHLQVEADYYASFALTNKGLIDASMILADECLKLVPSKIPDPVLHANLLNQKGRCYMRKNQYKEAIEMGLKVIEISEKSKDTLLQIKGKTLIGWAYLEVGPTSEALKWHLRALHTTDNTDLLEKYGILFANLALNYNGMGKTDSAFYFIDKAIASSRKYENLFALSNSLAIQAQLFVLSGNASKAEEPLMELVQIRKLIGDPFYIVSDMAQLALFYAHNGQPQKGIDLCKEGIAIAEKYNIGTKYFFLFGTLAENYKAAGDQANYALTLEKIINLKDSVYKKNSAEAVAEMQAKYNLQKKENQIIRQQNDITRQNYFFWGLLLVLLLLVGMAFFIFNDYKKKQKLKIELLHVEEQKLTTEAIMKAEEKERKRIAADLHDNMGAYASAILAGVDDLTIESKTDNPFLLTNMKNNANGIMMDLRDTIWVLKKESISITDTSDRFKDFVQKISPSYPDIDINIKENIKNNKSLSPQVAFNMLRIMQEAFHNALKHSHCSCINITISYDQGPQIKITDNGVGFGEYSDRIAGNGLQNMQQRAIANGWKVSIIHLSPNGTSVELVA